MCRVNLFLHNFKLQLKIHLSKILNINSNFNNKTNTYFSVKLLDFF